MKNIVKKGFSLIEVLCSLLIVSVVFLGAALVLLQSERHIRKALYESKALFGEEDEANGY